MTRSNNNSNKPRAPINPRDRLKLVRTNHPVMHSELGMVRFISFQNDEEALVSLPKGSQEVVDVTDLRPLDDSDWEDKDTAAAYRELITGAAYTRSWRATHVLRSSVGVTAVLLLEFLHEWQTTHARAEWFYCTVDTIVAQTFIPRRSVIRNMQLLRKRGILGVRKQLGNKNYYRIVWMNVAKEVRKASRDWSENDPGEG